MTPERRQYAIRAYGRSADAIAWKAPQSPRFCGVVANDRDDGPTLMDELRALPRWVVISGGGAFAAFLGVMMGAAFRL